MEITIQKFIHLFRDCSQRPWMALEANNAAGEQRSWVPVFTGPTVQ